MPAYVGLGSNLMDPARQLERALLALGELPDTRRVAVSSIWRSPPMGPQDQPDYFNAVAALLTRQAPEALLAGLQAIEDAQGRRRDGPRWGPRTLDLDLLAWGELRRQDDMLTLPHPGLAERPFVLLPLAEVAPWLRLPGLGLVATLAAAADTTGLRRVAETVQTGAA